MFHRSLIPKFKTHLKALSSIRTAGTAASTARDSANRDKYQELKNLDKRPLYLDAQATLPIDPRVLDAMLPYMTNMYGNPHSRTHAFGWESEKAVEDAREVSLSILTKKFKQI